MSAVGVRADFVRRRPFASSIGRMRVRAANVALGTKGLSLTPPALDPKGCLISATDKSIQLRRATLYPAELRARVSPH
jgi:hypothetical protein